jgi:hypothetical protein
VREFTENSEVSDPNRDNGGFCILSNPDVLYQPRVCWCDECR